MAEVALADAIIQLRTELARAMAEGEGQQLRFAVRDVELELTVGLTDTAGGEAKASLWTVLTLGAKGEHAKAATHHLKLTLSPHLAGHPEKSVDVAGTYG